MQSDYLESVEQGADEGGAMGIAKSIYGWSTLEMFSKISETGRVYVPWASKWLQFSLRGRGIKAQRHGVIDPWGDFVYGEKFRGASPRVKVPTMSAEGVIGSTYKRVGGRGFGNAVLAGSRMSKMFLQGLEWTDPLFAVVGNIASPWRIPSRLAVAASIGIWNNASGAMERARYVDVSNKFTETQGSYTSRQRSVRAISESHLQARSAIGNEAQMFHR
jgi:hypothetical protein